MRSESLLKPAQKGDAMPKPDPILADSVERYEGWPSIIRDASRDCKKDTVAMQKAVSSQQLKRQ
jgi:hypothetical protein